MGVARARVGPCVSRGRTHKHPTVWSPSSTGLSTAPSLSPWKATAIVSKRPVFGSRRIERATYRDIGARYITADTHPDHDTICKFHREVAG